MRIALLDRETLRGWRGCGNRFTGVAARLAATGHDVLLVGAPPARGMDGGTRVRCIDLAPAEVPTLTALDRAGPAGAMLDAHLAAHTLAPLNLDLIMAPLRGGLAQGILMARACGEAFARAHVALWCDGTSRDRFLTDESPTLDIAPLIADALERQTLALADAAIVADDNVRKRVARLGAMPAAILRADLPHTGLATPGRIGPTEEIGEIVHVGPMARAHGTDAFVEAVERLSADGTLGSRMVSFLGPAQTQGAGLGPQWLGLRAQAWPFPFRLLERSWSESLDYLGAGHRLAVMVAADPDQVSLLDGCGARAIVLRDTTGCGTGLALRLEQAMAAALADRGETTREERANGDWNEIAARILDLPHEAATAGTSGITVCILHRNRLATLAQTLASVPDELDGTPVELLVVDNASTIDDVESAIRDLAGAHVNLRVLRLERGLPFAGAYNAGLAAARFETVIFLDDDNLLTPDGAARLARAIGSGTFDIVVSPLDVFDHAGAAPGPTVARTIFLGAAHSAGLFFNAFGDTAMAVRRDAFRGIGGFHDIGIPYPCADWTTLARAQAAGLRIGTLQWPAFRYRRDTARTDRSAIKLDQEGARRFVRAAYGAKLDAELIARYAQGLDISLA